MSLNRYHGGAIPTLCWLDLMTWLHGPPSPFFCFFCLIFFFIFFSMSLIRCHNHHSSNSKLQQQPRPPCYVFVNLFFRPVNKGNFTRSRSLTSVNSWKVSLWSWLTWKSNFSAPTYGLHFFTFSMSSKVMSVSHSWIYPLHWRSWVVASTVSLQLLSAGIRCPNHTL